MQSKPDLRAEQYALSDRGRVSSKKRQLPDVKCSHGVPWDLHSTTSCNGLVTHWVLIQRNGFASLELEVCSGSRNVGVL
jgi:hypothetical protein